MRNFITTPIYYVNDKPHIGHLYTTILADLFSRYKRLKGEEVFFQSGTDENGLNIVRIAEKNNKNVKEFVDEISKEFKALKEKFNLSLDNFIRTTSEEHKNGVYKLWDLCKNDIYIDKYEGKYCLSCEAYYQDEEIIDNLCPIHKRPLENFSEKNYFFKLTKYLDEIKGLIEENRIKIIPNEIRIQILDIIRGRKLKDLSISRDAERSKGWGIKVPNDDSQIIYVWFDALTNYLSGLGFGSNNEENYKKFWEDGKIFHFIGKDIAKFHSIYWPAFLISAGLKTPDYIICNYFILNEGEKISKTLGNMITVEDLLKDFNYEFVRYYLITQGTEFKDWSFSWEHYKEVYEGELKNEIGNLASRIFGLLKNMPFDKLVLDKNLLENDLKDVENVYEDRFENFEFSKAYKNVFSFVKRLNRFIDEKRIWESKNEDDYKTLIINLDKIAKFYLPLLPESMEKILIVLDLKNNIFENKRINFEPLFK
ncbi:MAG: methionine--tRNA ligase [Minisyncoccia bacterium]